MQQFEDSVSTERVTEVTWPLRQAATLGQLVERSSGDREVPGSIPGVSRSSEWAPQM